MNLIILKYGFPNVGKPLNYHHLRSFIMGDAYRRILVAQNIDVMADLHCNDIGENIGNLLYYINHINSQAEFKTATDLHKAYYFVKNISQDKTEIEKDVIQEVIKLQADPNYKKNVKINIRNIFEHYIQKFMNQLNVCIDRFTKESEYLDKTKLIIDNLAHKDLITQDGLEISMKEMTIVPSTPLMIRHKDGRYLFAGIFYIAGYYDCKHFNSKKIMYFVTVKYNTQMYQIIDAGLKFDNQIKIIHFSYGDIIVEDTDIVRDPDLLLEAIATSPCDLQFPDSEHKRRFMRDVFKLENYWKEPNKRVYVAPHKMYKTKGYKLLKNYAYFRQRYADQLQLNYTSPALSTALHDSMIQYSLVPLMDLLRAHIMNLRQDRDSAVAINTAARIIAILGLDDWEVINAGQDDETI